MTLNAKGMNSDVEIRQVTRWLATYMIPPRRIQPHQRIFIPSYTARAVVAQSYI